MRKLVTIVVLAGLISGCGYDNRRALYQQDQAENAVRRARAIDGYNRLHPGAEEGTPAWEIAMNKLRIANYEHSQTSEGRAIEIYRLNSEIQMELSGIAAQLSAYH